MANSKPVIPLQLTGEDVLLKRVAGNFERHGDDHVPVLDITCEAVVPPAVMVGLLGTYCDRTLFNLKGELPEPADVFKHTDMPLPLEQDLVAQFVSFTLSDNIEREFGEQPEEGDDPAPSQLCPITNIRYEPKVGGCVWLGFSIRIRPRDGAEYWAFLEHQQRHAKLTIADSAIKVGNGKQQSLPLNGGGRPEPAMDSADQDESTPANYDQRSTIENGDGTTTELKSGKEIDDAMLAENPGGETMGSSGSSLEEIGPETRKAIEQAKNRRRRRPIDGRKGAH